MATGAGPATELADVGIGGVGGVEVTEMTRVFDVWFDNIFSDWSVRSRISEAGGRVARAQGPAVEVRRVLTARAAGLAAEIGRLESRRHELLARVAPVADDRPADGRTPGSTSLG